MKRSITTFYDDLDALFDKSITQKETKEEVRQLLDALHIFYDSINSTVGGIVITDLEGYIVFINPAFMRMFEYDAREEVLGKNAADLFATGEIRRFSDVQQITHNTEATTKEFIVQSKNGATFIVELTSAVITNSSGKITGRMASFVDISEREKRRAGQGICHQQTSGGPETDQVTSGHSPCLRFL